MYDEVHGSSRGNSVSLSRFAESNMPYPVQLCLENIPYVSLRLKNAFPKFVYALARGRHLQRHQHKVVITVVKVRKNIYPAPTLRRGKRNYIVRIELGTLKLTCWFTIIYKCKIEYLFYKQCITMLHGIWCCFFPSQWERHSFFHGYDDDYNENR